jgi:predicted RNase H-like nuclease
MDVYIGFDSAWTDNPKAPGAICAVGVENKRPVWLEPPELVSFDQALTFIHKFCSKSGVILIALDQPTVVPNSTGMRPVEHAAASLIGWLGGGVQPSNRRRCRMFCDAAPIWGFLKSLGAEENPEQARTADNGLFLVEVFPALALASLDDGFFGRLRAPKYNPIRGTFRSCDWKRVTNSAQKQARQFGCEELAEWCRAAEEIAQPRKPDQDKLDSALCVLIAMHWRLRPRESSLILGDLSSGYMVLPASPQVRDYLTCSARNYSVAIDGKVPF